MKKFGFIVLSGLLGLLMSVDVYAAPSEAPAPRRSPHTPVQRQTIVERRSEAPPKQLQGSVTVLDSERLSIGNYEFRLFGIVPPQISANFGPQTRKALDDITAGQVANCTITDRSREGRLLAVCKTSKGTDVAQELLRRGLAVTARGSLANSDLAIGYLSAEQTAQATKSGLWSLAPAAPAPESAKAESTGNSLLTMWGSKPVPAQEAAAIVPDVKPTPPVAPNATAPSSAPPAQSSASVNMSPVMPAAVTPKPTHSETPATTNDSIWAIIERIQILLASLVMMVTIIGAVFMQGRQKKQEQHRELASIAAALRGELLAARAICNGRLRQHTDIHDTNITWPRVRSTLYQAYVGRIGMLGAELARQVAAIYGQASDYAAYYDVADDERRRHAPPRHALETLVGYIEAVLPKLEQIEDRGTLVPSRLIAQSPKTHAPILPPSPPKDQAPKHPVLEKEVVAETKEIVAPSASTEAPPQIKNESVATIAKSEKVEVVGEQVTNTQATVSVIVPPAPTQEPKTDPVHNLVPQSPVQETKQKLSPLPLWDAVRSFAQERLTTHKPATQNDDITDYSALIEEEMANLGTYDDDDVDARYDSLKKLRG